jgi:hypothetical protein
MNTLKSLVIMLISTTCMMIDVASKGMIGWLDGIATRMLTSEHICVRCGTKNKDVSPNEILCPDCKMEVEAEDYEDEDYEDESGGPHPHSPMYR